MKKCLYPALMLFALLSCDDSASKSHLLTIDKDWEDRSQTEKLIGCWCRDSGSHTSRRGLRIDFKMKYCFYNDGTMDEYMIADSYGSSTDLLRSGKDVDVDDNILTYRAADDGALHESTIVVEENALLMDNVRHYKCN